MTHAYRCPVDGCSYAARSAEDFRGHMAGRMQNDPAHRWENVPISHHDLEPARERTDESLDGFGGEDG